MKTRYKILILLSLPFFFGDVVGVGFGVLEKYPDYDIFLQVIAGVIGVALGYYLTVALNKPEKKNEYTFTVFSSLCVSGTIIAIRKLVQFFIDFYMGTDLLHCHTVEDDHWLFRVFGFGMSPYEQRPLFDTDEDLGVSLVAALLSTAALYLYLRVKNKALFIRSTEGRRQRRSAAEFIRDRFSLEAERLRRDCSIWDFILWWGTRAVMLHAFIVMENRAEANLLLANLVGTFAVTLIHLLLPANTALARISYKAQTLLVIMIFLGSWCGNYVGVYYITVRFDLFLHFISGALCVMGGYYIALTLIKPETKKQVLLVSLFALCFSFFVIPAWEVSEFIGDFIWGTDNQGFYWGPTEDSFFFKMFGHGVGNTKLYYLFDTVYDMLLAAVTTVITFAGLYLGLVAKRKKAVNKGGNDKKETEENVVVYC